MPAYCAPWPENSQATLGVPALPLTSRRGVVSAATASAASVATTAARCAYVRRPARSVWATSARSASPPSRCPASRDTAASSADDVRADSSSRCASRGWAVGSGAGGACSTSTCAFVPPMPKELTPARRGKPFVSHLVSDETTLKGFVPKSMRGFGDS